LEVQMDGESPLVILITCAVLYSLYMPNFVIDLSSTVQSVSAGACQLDSVKPLLRWNRFYWVWPSSALESLQTPLEVPLATIKTCSMDVVTTGLPSEFVCRCHMRLPPFLVV